MLGKSGSTPNVSITSKGAISVDANELFHSPNVQRIIKKWQKQSRKRFKSPQNLMRVPVNTYGTI